MNDRGRALETGRLLSYKDVHVFPREGKESSVGVTVGAAPSLPWSTAEEMGIEHAGMLNFTL